MVPAVWRTARSSRQAIYGNPMFDQCRSFDIVFLRYLDAFRQYPFNATRLNMIMVDVLSICVSYIFMEQCPFVRGNTWEDGKIYHIMSVFFADLHSRVACKYKFLCCRHSEVRGSILGQVNVKNEQPYFVLGVGVCLLHIHGTIFMLWLIFHVIRHYTVTFIKLTGVVAQWLRLHSNTPRRS